MITSFSESYAFLSNFYHCKIEYEGLIYDSSEAAYQAAKTHLVIERERFVGIHASLAKRKGRRVTLRKDWEEVKFKVMEDILRIKFSHRILKAQLLGTGEEFLMEGNWWGDKVWGMVYEGGEWVGENHLGKLLMKIRAELAISVS